MTMLLANASPDASTLAQWISVLMYLGGFVCTVIGGLVGVKKLREPAAASVVVQPSPLTVQAAATYATKEAHEALVKKMDEELGRERSSRKKIHEEIAALQAQTAALKKETDSQTVALLGLRADLGKTNERIDAVPERTINLLRSTKDLI